jgi:hypothetical protein
MASSKHARLSNRPGKERDEDRTSLSISGRCRAGDRAIQDVLVLDLAPQGCRVLGLTAGGVTKNDPLELWMGDLGPITARLTGIKRGSLELEFAEPMDVTAIERLATTDPTPNVLPMRRSRTN